MIEPRENVARSLFAGWNEGSREIDPAEVTEDIVVRSALTGNEFQGRDGIRRWMEEIDDQFDHWKMEIDGFHLVEPDGLLALGVVYFRGRASGLETEQPIGWLFRFKEGRVVELRTFADQESAREAVGLG